VANLDNCAEGRLPLGIRQLDMPLTPAKVWRAISEATP